MSALLPCPFCGGEGEYDNADDSAARWIWCKGCGAKVTAEFSDEAAIAAWNQRTTPAEVASLKREVERLRGALAQLYRGYVNTLEIGRDRITGLGGTCDPVDVMENGDPCLIAARTALAHKEPGDEG